MTYIFQDIFSLHIIYCNNTLCTGYLRELFKGFGDIESVSVSEFKKPNNIYEKNDDNDSNESSQDILNNLNKNEMSIFSNPSSSSESRFAHVIFTKKNILKSILSASDTVYYELTKTIAKVSKTCCIIYIYVIHVLFFLVLYLLKLLYVLLCCAMLFYIMCIFFEIFTVNVL